MKAKFLGLSDTMWTPFGIARKMLLLVDLAEGLWRVSLRHSEPIGRSPSPTLNLQRFGRIYSGFVLRLNPPIDHARHFH